MRLFRSGRRLFLVGVLAIAAIGASVTWMISEQRADALAEASKFGINLAQLLVEHTSSALQPVYLTLQEIAERMTSDQSRPGQESNWWGDWSIHDWLVQQLESLPQTAALFFADADRPMVSSPTALTDRAVSSPASAGQSLACLSGGLSPFPNVKFSEWIARPHSWH